MELTSPPIHDHGSDSEGGSSLRLIWSPRMVSKTAAYTAVKNDVVICPSGTFTVTLTGAARVGKGGIICVKNLGAGTITVDGAGAETIDGAATASLNSPYLSVFLISDGSTWHKF